MGVSYTIDTPIKVARFGISSVVSIIEDSLIERMREYYYNKNNKPFKPITKNESDYRAKRITDYLNLMNQIVHEQFEKIKSLAFEKGSEIVQYFEMLPNDSKLKQAYLLMASTEDEVQKLKMQDDLRMQMKPGRIDVNIMVKVDNNRHTKDGLIIEDGSDAVTALRGYANSNLKNSAIVFSAGMNPRLYNYLEKLEEFIAQSDNPESKKIIIKVSDYRSALIQGKYLAKKGIWVSEFRVESGLNCGGHAFASDGYLMGPILEEFKEKREEICLELYTLYCKALVEKGKPTPAQMPKLKISAQGGIGTCQENELLLDYYNLDSTGWGSPMLLVPEATTVDEQTLEKLCEAGEQDIILSNHSPLGVKFNTLRLASSENEKQLRIGKGHPGSPCPEKLLVSNTEFTKEPICTASLKYQRLKLQQISEMEIEEAERKKMIKGVTEKECLCVGLSNAATTVYAQKPLLHTSSGVSICPGPNLAYFNKVVSLKEMIDHIYGHTNILNQSYRPHFFIKELQLYINYLKEEIATLKEELDKKTNKYYLGFCNNLLDGIAYYKQRADKLKIPSFNIERELKTAENYVLKTIERFSIPSVEVVLT